MKITRPVNTFIIIVFCYYITASYLKIKCNDKTYLLSTALVGTSCANMGANRSAITFVFGFQLAEVAVNDTVVSTD